MAVTPGSFEGSVRMPSHGSDCHHLGAQSTAAVPRTSTALAIRAAGGLRNRRSAGPSLERALSFTAPHALSCHRGRVRLWVGTPTCSRKNFFNPRRDSYADLGGWPFGAGLGGVLWAAVWGGTPGQDPPVPVLCDSGRVTMRAALWGAARMGWCGCGVCWGLCG